MIYQHVKSAIRVIDIAMTEERLTALQASRMLATIEGATPHDLTYCLSDENIEALASAGRDERRRKNRLRETSTFSFRRWTSSFQVCKASIFSLVGSTNKPS